MKIIKRLTLPLVLVALVIGVTGCAHPHGGHGGGGGGGGATTGHK